MRLLFLLAMLAGFHFLPSQDLGKPFAQWVDRGAVVTAYENGLTRTFDDTSRVTVTMDSPTSNGGGAEYSTTWQTTVNGAILPITVTYSWPTPNPTEAQRRLYRARFKEEVQEMLLLFPRNP